MEENILEFQCSGVPEINIYGILLFGLIVILSSTLNYLKILADEVKLKSC